MYVSDRKLPLICQTLNTKFPTVTVENYCKWYNVFVINPDGVVVTADWEVLNMLEYKSGKCLIGDHVYHPDLLVQYADYIGGYVDDVSLETVAGRWMFEFHDKSPEEL